MRIAISDHRKIVGNISGCAENDAEHFFDRVYSNKRKRKPRKIRKVIKTENDISFTEAMVDQIVKKEEDTLENVDQPFLSEETYESIKSKVKTQKKVKEFSCEVCPRKFSRIRNLKQHMKVHTRKTSLWELNKELKTYTCEECSETFSERPKIVDHIKNNHFDPFHCFECNKRYFTAYSFSAHVRRHNGNKMFKCPLCDYSNESGAEMSSHLNTAHYQKSYECKTCGESFKDRALFKKHISEHSSADKPEKPFVCIVCNKSFMCEAHLFRHQISVHTVCSDEKPHPLQCHICLKVFLKVESKNKHIFRNHVHIKKSHLCDICGKGFSGHYTLKLHYRTHTGEKPHPCLYCPKSFSKKDYLILHLRTHTGEKPFSCEYCGKAFNQRSALRTHIRGHTDEKPFNCEFCGLGFTSKPSLISHKKICLGY